MEMGGPLATMRGPGRYPLLMELRRSTARNGSEPTSRTVVNPASRSFLAFTTPAKALSKGVSLKLKISSYRSALEPRCVWQSISPGSTTACERSVTCAPAGISISAAVPTRVMRSFWISITTFCR